MNGQKLWTKVFPFISVLILTILLFSAGCGTSSPAPQTAPAAPGSAPYHAQDSGKGVTGAPPPAPMKPQSPGLSQTQPTPYAGATNRSESIGLATGGAKDVNNFRENINNGYLPLPTDITYEGLFYDYYFDTGQQEPCNKLFCPSYSYAVTRDPFSSKTEYYLSVGLNSGLKESDFERKQLNLAIVLDISGSMGSKFDTYYYDGYGRRVDLDIRERNRSKIEVARDAVRSILDQLNSGDMFSIVTFNDRASLLQKPVSADDFDSDWVGDNIDNVRPTGSTNLADGMRLATDTIKKFDESDASQFENRIIFLTDAMPNTGETGEYSLRNQLKSNADNRIYTTFIGIGVDFNSELVEYISKIKGANYYSVHSPSQFQERIDQEFDFMVTPLVFNLQLTLDSQGWDIDTVYGSPEADKSTGEIMKVNTLFPSKKEGGETKGGLILLKLKKRGFGSGDVRIKVSYEDRQGHRESSEAWVSFETARPEYFDNTGIQKGILLARYANLIKDWTIDQREHVRYNDSWKPRVDTECGICLPPTNFGTWERQSMSLVVAPEYRSLFYDFSHYFSAVMEEIGDNSLGQELDIIYHLAGNKD